MADNMVIRNSLKPGEPSDPKQVMQRHGSTFHLAAKLLSNTDYDAAARLYAFCRHADDLADESADGSGLQTLQVIRHGLQFGTCAGPAGKDFAAMLAEYKIPRSVALAFIDALIQDHAPRRFETVSEVVRFSYGVASTVGVMLCHVFGVRSSAAMPFAIDLGIAMQITNISRDVLEDAERGRIYVPTQLAGKSLQAHKIVDGDPLDRLAAWQGVRKLLALADTYYTSARRGMRYLPEQIRPAVLVAADVYRGIGDQILAEPNLYWSRRAVVPRHRKALLTSRALLACLFDPVVRGRVPAPVHEKKLHLALQGSSS